jgi:hypothetical protein
MSNPFFERPIANSPYEHPRQHWELDETGQPTGHLIDRRRRAEFIPPIPKPKKRRGSRRGELDLDEGKGQIERLPLKLATWAGKTMVMAMPIAWQTLNAVRRHGSKHFTRGFPVPKSGRIAVKVINHLGDEVMKVFRVE